MGAVVPVLLVLMVPSAAAIPPTRETLHYEYPMQTFGGACEDFGLLSTGTAQQRWTYFYDGSGELTLSTVHFSFTGNLYNATDTTNTVAYYGGGYWQYDTQYVSDLSTYHFMAVIDGRPVPMVVGLEKYSYDPYGVVVHTNTKFMPVICEGLS